jgi:hypothetical protein
VVTHREFAIHWRLINLMCPFRKADSDLMRKLRTGYARMDSNDAALKKAFGGNAIYRRCHPLGGA